MQTPLHIVLMHPEIPHNTGAVGRLCVGLDCDLTLIRPLGFTLSDAHIKRAGLDYWQHLRLSVYDSWEDYEKTVALHLERVFFLSTKGSKSLYEARFEPGDTLVFGCESAGLPPEFYTRYPDRLYCIPMPGDHARSINLSNSVAISAYEAYRQLLPRL